MIRRASLYALVMLLVPLGALLAEEETAKTDYARTGFYGGVGGSYVFQNFDTQDDASNFWGVSGRAGYRFHRLVATELVFDFFPSFGGFDDSRSTAQINAHAWDITANGKLYPESLTGRFQPYAIGGVGVMRVDQSSEDARTEIVGRVGAGFDLHLNEKVRLYLEGALLAPGGSLTDFRSVPVQLGFQYRLN
jgi:opacity protein-like surface antigen